MTRSSNYLLEKSIREINYLKFKKALFQDISFQNISKESNYSYRQLMKLVKCTKEHKLAKFSVSINYPLLGIFTTFTHVSLSNQRYANEFINIIKDLDFVQNIYFIGQRKVTFILRMRALSYDQINKFAHTIRKKAGDLITFTNTSLVCSTYLSEGKSFSSKINLPKPKLDDKDFEIIRLLQQNAHWPLSHIAKKVNLREPTVHRRIKQLKDKKVILGYHLVRKWNKIPAKNWPISAVCEVNTNVDFNDLEILNLPSIKNNTVHIRYLYETYGSTDLLFSFSTNNMMGFRKFVYEELAGLMGISNIKSYMSLESINKTVKFYPE